MPIKVPPEVEVAINGGGVTIKGPKGELSRSFHPDMVVSLHDSTLTVARPSDSRIHRSLHGLTRSLLANMVEGVTKGFQRTLELSGVGYRAQSVGGKLVMQLGFSHPVEMVPPPQISIAVEGNNRIVIVGIDKELVGEVAAKIRAIKPPEPYKGKGVKYIEERIRRKAGKAAGKAGRAAK
jgi:large subunit ribosomal protein L6